MSIIAFVVFDSKVERYRHLPFPCTGGSTFSKREDTMDLVGKEGAIVVLVAEAGGFKGRLTPRRCGMNTG